jgi:hypothetical protein
VVNANATTTEAIIALRLKIVPSFTMEVSCNNGGLRHYFSTG